MKKGFTLMELLAVIVILAVVGLIVTPILVGYIEKSRVSSYRSSVQTLIEKTKEYVSKTEENNDFPIGGIDITKVDLNLKNAEFKNGVIEKDEKGQIYARNVYNGKYCANGTKNNLVVEKVDKLEDCQSVDATPPEIKKIIINNVTSTSITIVVNASDAQSGIKEFEYCIGEECTKQNKNNYTFKNLKPNTEYEIIVKVRNGNYGTGDQYTKEVTETSKKVKATTNIVEKPIFKVSSLTYSSSKIVTIKYPKKQEGYIYSYKIELEDGTVKKEEIIETEEQKLTVTENCTITATIKVGSEEINESLTIIGIDGKGPEVIVINPNKWDKIKQITIKAKDIGSGLAKKAYSYDGGASWTSNNKRSYATNTKVKILVKDKLGNITNKYKVCKDENGTDCEEKEGEIEIDRVDSEPPKCKLKVTSGTPGNLGWYVSGVNIGFESVVDTYKPDPNKPAIEGGSGVASQEIDLPTVTKNGKTVITGKVKDLVGNEGTCQIEVNIDTVKPVCGSWSGENTTWTKADRTIKVACSDGTSGCTANTYDVKTYTSGTTSTEALSYIVYDQAGNSDLCSKTASVYVDKDAPSCGNWTGEGTTWTKSNRTIGIGCTDTGSGCTASSYNVKTYTSGTTSTAALSYTIKDNVGNTNVCSKTANVYVDKTPPTCISSGGPAEWTTGSRKLVGTCADPGGSGCTGNVSKTYNTEGFWNNQSPGTVYDNVGNSTACPANQIVGIERTVSAPTLAGSNTTNGNPIILYISKTSTAASGIYKYQYYESTSPTSLAGGSWKDFSADQTDLWPVFDAAYYYMYHADVRSAFGTNAQSGYDHFKNYGMNEGRRGSQYFDVNTYKNNYGDLRNAFGTNLPAYYSHYITNGQREGRNAGGVDWLRTAQVIKTQGVRYVFVRAVSNALNVSQNSNYQTTTIKRKSCRQEEYTDPCKTTTNTCKPSYKKCNVYEKLPSVYYFKCTFTSLDKCKNVKGGEAYDPKTATTYYGCYYMTDPPYSGQFRCTSKKVYKSSSVCGIENSCATGSPNECVPGTSTREVCEWVV